MSASELKERGNLQFKSGKLSEAVKLYMQAEELAPNDPVYPSNLSAALYESGDYAACFFATLRAFKLLLAKTQQRNTALIDRLSIRLAKTLRYGTRSGGLPHRLAVSESAASTISDVKKLITESDKDEVSRVWDEWSAVESQIKQSTESKGMGRERLARLPMYKISPARVREYFSISHDDPMSIIHDYGTEEKNPIPLKIQTFSDERLSNISFLFGGVGDARHVFASIIGLHKTFVKLPKAKRDKVKVHVTLLDIHPTTLSRDLMVLMLLDELLSGNHTPNETVEIKATLFYVYTAMIMPSYCFNRCMQVIKDLRQRLSVSLPLLPPWIHVISASIPELLRSLDYWIAVCPETTSDEMLEHHNEEKWKANRDQNHATFTSGAYPAFQGHEDRLHEGPAAEVEKVPDEEIVKIGMNMLNEEYPTVPTDPIEKAKFIRWTRDRLIEYLKDQGMDCNGKDSAALINEKLFYKVVRAFMPPLELRSRHLAMANGWKDLRALQDMQKSHRVVPKARLSAMTQLLVEARRDDISDNWRPNPSLFDISFDEGDGYPTFHYSGFDPIIDLEGFNVRMGLQTELGSKAVEDCPAYSVTAIFFDAVLEGLKALKDKIQLEILRGELNQEVLKMRMSDDQHRRAHFPRAFTRIWQSNVPDYTHGPLNTAVHVVPALQTYPDCSAASNCLLNSPIFRTDDEFCYTYTLLTIQDVPRYLGCQVLSMSPNFDIINLGSQPLPRPLTELASRTELISWLIRVLFATLLAARDVGMLSVRYPNNLVAFVHLLIHLISVGFPAHWLSDFLQSILSDTVVTDVALYTGNFPIPTSELNRRVANRKVCLKPWLIDFETILATSYEILPFSLTPPPGFSVSYSDIALFETELSFLWFNPMSSAPRRPSHIPVISLIFYKDSKNLNAIDLITNIPQILDGKKKYTGKGELFIMTVVERFDVRDGVIRWRMSRKRMRIMKMQKWVMASYRFDAQEIVSMPDEAKNWKEITEA